MLSIVSWTGGGDGKNWSDVLNWSTHALPGASDDVTINAPGSPTITYSLAVGATQIQSLSSSDPLAITGGSLTVTASSTLTAGLTMTGGSLTVTGAGVTLADTGPTVLDSASLSVANGATLALPSDTTLLFGVDFTADGANSTLDLSALASLDTSGSSITDTHSATVSISNGITTVQGLSFSLDGSGMLPIDQFTSIINGGVTLTGGNYALANLDAVDFSSFQVDTGAQLALPGLTAVPEGANFVADGAGSVVDISAVTAWTSFEDGVTATHGGTVQVGSGLTSLTGVTVTLDGTGTFPIGQFTSITNGGVTVKGGNYSLANLTDIDDSEMQVASGGHLSLPLITSASNAIRFSAAGAGSVLDVSAITSMNGFDNQLSATSGGAILLNAGLMSLVGTFVTVDGTETFPLGQFTSITNGGITVLGGTYLLPNLTDFDGSVATVQAGSLSLPGLISPGNSAAFESTGATSHLDISNVTSFNGGYNLLQATGGGSLAINAGLTTLDGVRVVIDDASSFPIGQLTAITDGGLTVLSGTFTLPALADIDGSSLSVNGGGSLTLPNLVTYQNDQSFNYGTSFNVFDDGGTLAVPALTSITTGSFSAYAQGAGSHIDLSSVTVFSTSSNSLSATSGATIALNAGITSLANTALTVDAGGGLPLGQFTSLVAGNLTILGGTYNLPGLTDIDGRGSPSKAAVA